MEFKVDAAALAHVRDTFWDNFYGAGGFGMYPTTFWGFLLLVYAGLYFLRPQLRYLRAVAILAFMTLANGALGTASGFIIAFRYAATVEPELAARSASYGAAESLHVVVLALMLMILGGIITGAGSWREARQRATS